MKKTTKVIIILSILLILAVGFIIVGGYKEFKEQEQVDIFQQGTQYGYDFAINQIIEQVVDCKQVPLIFGNQTINIVAVNCLQLGGI